MAEGTYEYECARAELLGIASPNRDEFEAAARERQQKHDNEHETLLDVEVQDEQLKHTSGKFDELNGILSVTQQRLNKFKSACGSLTNLLKLRPGKDEASSGADDVDATATREVVKSDVGTLDGALDVLDAMKDEAAQSDVQIVRKSAADMQQKMSCQFSALDSMLNKAENAEYAMNKQNRDMKRMMK